MNILKRALSSTPRRALRPTEDHLQLGQLSRAREDLEKAKAELEAAQQGLERALGVEAEQRARRGAGGAGGLPLARRRLQDAEDAFELARRVVKVADADVAAAQKRAPTAKELQALENELRAAISQMQTHGRALREAANKLEELQARAGLVLGVHHPVVWLPVGPLVIAVRKLEFVLPAPAWNEDQWLSLEEEDHGRTEDPAA